MAHHGVGTPPTLERFRLPSLIWESGKVRWMPPHGGASADVHRAPHAGAPCELRRPGELWIAGYVVVGIIKPCRRAALFVPSCVLLVLAAAPALDSDAGPALFSRFFFSRDSRRSGICACNACGSE